MSSLIAGGNKTKGTIDVVPQVGQERERDPCACTHRDFVKNFIRCCKVYFGLQRGETAEEGGNHREQNRVGDSQNSIQSPGYEMLPDVEPRSTCLHCICS